MGEVTTERMAEHLLLRNYFLQEVSLTGRH